MNGKRALLTPNKWLDGSAWFQCLVGGVVVVGLRAALMFFWLTNKRSDALNIEGLSDLFTGWMFPLLCGTLVGETVRRNPLLAVNALSAVTGIGSLILYANTGQAQASFFLTAPLSALAGGIVVLGDRLFEHGPFGGKKGKSSRVSTDPVAPVYFTS